MRCSGKKNFFVRTISFLIVFLVFPTSSIRAEEPSKGISVSPSIIRLDLTQEKAQTTLTYKNTSAQGVSLELTAQDFTELEEGFRVKFLDEKNSENYKYGLSSWINFEKKTLALEPNEEKTVKLFIDEDELTPGAHYASILAQIKTTSTNDTVPIHAILSSLLFVRVETGKSVVEAKIQNFDMLQKFFLFPEKAFLRFQNTGNVEIIPNGLLEITNQRDITVAKGIINQGSLITLPESIRRYNTDLIEQRKVIFPGRYQARITVSLEEEKTIIETKTFFTFGNKQFLIPAGIQLLAILLLIKKIKKKKGSSTKTKKHSA